MSCYHDVHVTGDEKLMADIGAHVKTRWVLIDDATSARRDVIVIGQNVYIAFETNDACLCDVEQVAAMFPAARVVHMYQYPIARLRGIAIYERGRRANLRQVVGARFRLNDWLSFPTFDDNIILTEGNSGAAFGTRQG